MDYRRLLAIPLLVSASLIATGCGESSGAETLDKSGDVVTFIKDAVDHKQVEWKLASNAAEAAKNAWEHREALFELIDKLGERVGEKAPDWGCKVLDQANNGSVEASAVMEVSEGNLSESEAQRVIAEIQELNSNEVAELTRDICDVAHS